jgi:DNA polymerase-3 subunit delta'
MLFSEITGQQDVKRRLLQTVKDQRISHAQLFLGPEGSGKIALALAYAQFINCRNRPELTAENLGTADACGTCPSCVKFNKLSHPDLHFIFPVATTKEVPKKPMSRNFLVHFREALRNNEYMLTLNDWYDKIGTEKKQGIINAEDCSEILRTLSYKSYESEYKVMIIWMAERLYHSAAPKLLKILEEPPDKTLFILISEKQEQIINTILSRTQIVKIPPIDSDSLKSTIIEKHNLDERRAEQIANLANGNYLKARKLILNEQDQKELFESFVKWMRLSFALKIYELNQFIGKFAASGREKHKNFLDYSARMIRNSLMLNQDLEKTINLTKEEKDFLEKFRKLINLNNVTEISSLLDKAQYHIERNANPQFTFMDLSMKIHKLLKGG